jgi:pimeloyl-ACP methyl ester carboxylesterase
VSQISIANRLPKAERALWQQSCTDSLDGRAAMKAKEIDHVTARAELQKLDPREEHFFTPGPTNGLKLFLRYLAPGTSTSKLRPVLYVHGMSFPSALSIAYRFDGRSWRDELCDAGFDVWGLDFYGFGFSDRYPEMNQPPELHPPLGRVSEASRQIEHAARFICRYHALPGISIIAHSGGAIATNIFACRCPELVERLVLFAPIAQRTGDHSEAQRFPAWRLISLSEAQRFPAWRLISLSEAQRFPAWRLISLKDQWDRFIADVPKGQAPVLLERHFRDWGGRYLESDPESGTRSPASVKVPCGLIQDVVDAWHGAAAYDPAQVSAPVAIIRGEWDTWSRESDCRSLFETLVRSPMKRLTTISRGTHLMHLEESRRELHLESIAFLRTG